MYLALPSGSSPLENPPGNIIIWDCSIAFVNSSIDCSISFSRVFLITTVIGVAPASKKAFSLSYSQFVPGNTGITTFTSSTYSG